MNKKPKSGQSAKFILDMNTSEQTRKDNLKLLRICSDLRELKMPVNKYYTLDEQTSKIVRMEPEKNSGVIETSVLNDKEKAALISFLENREIEFKQGPDVIYSDGVKANRYIVKLSTIQDSPSL